MDLYDIEKENMGHQVVRNHQSDSDSTIVEIL